MVNPIYKSKTLLGRLHERVINKAPDEMKPRLRYLASMACLRKYDETGDLDFYLDSEAFYHNKK